MEFAEVARRRRMIRNYDPHRAVPADVRDRILAQTLDVPLLVLDDAADRDRFWAAATPGTGGRERWLAGMRTAPLIAIPHAAQGSEQWYVDPAFTVLLMLLTVVDEGLGACFFGIPGSRTAAYRAEFGVPAALSPVGALTIGYRAPDHRSASLARGRRPVEEVVHRGQW